MIADAFATLNTLTWHTSLAAGLMAGLLVLAGGLVLIAWRLR
ncbi:hypothetical protein U9R90_05380 [Streptomyces sp. E11-3]